jgi:hypothetical protein
MDEHMRWLISAVSRGAKRHDSFEVERHFAVSAKEAVDLGARLHEIAGRPQHVIVVVVERGADGRLGRPEFS